MSSKKWLVLAAWALLPLTATAQQEHSSPASNQSASSGNALAYSSAFADYRSFEEEGPDPDKVWRATNDDMGVLGGHAGHMKDAPAVTPEASRQERTAVRQNSSMDHSKHHGGGK